jgi:hypothetical protein
MDRDLLRAILATPEYKELATQRQAIIEEEKLLREMFLEDVWEVNVQMYHELHYDFGYYSQEGVSATQTEYKVVVTGGTDPKNTALEATPGEDAFDVDGGPANQERAIKFKKRVRISSSSKRPKIFPSPQVKVVKMDEDYRVKEHGGFKRDNPFVDGWDFRDDGRSDWEYHEYRDECY